MGYCEEDSVETRQLLKKIEMDDADALAELLSRHREDLNTFVRLRFDQQLSTRLDPSDVVQEAQIEVVKRMKDFLQRRPMPFYLWLKKTALQRLIDLRRHHVERHCRTVKREEFLANRSSLLMLKPFFDKAESPSKLAQTREFAERVASVVSLLNEVDQEILLMRHGEEMSFEEIGCLLEIESSTARKRFGRALLRLQQLLKEHGILGGDPQ